MTPILTIIVPVYNHEQYLQEALQSIEKQNIEYTYEVIIGEDCSSDSSRTVLKNYQKNTPENYYYIYRQKNLGMFDNITDLFYRAKGKYIIVLEGDDYWLYDNKINEQVAFLEANMEYCGYAHSVLMVDENGQVLKEEYLPEKGSGIYTINDYLQGKLPGQTASFMYRNYFFSRSCFKYLEDNKEYPLDRFISFVVATEGNIYCTSQKWSAYRYVTQGGTSYSANIQCTSPEFALSALKYHKALYSYTLSEHCSKKSVKVSEKLYFKSYVRDWISDKDKNISELISTIKEIKYPITTFIWIFFQLLKNVESKGKRYEKNNDQK